MRDVFIGATPDQIIARLREVAEPIAAGPVIVRLSEESHGFRNVGLDLPKRRRSRLESLNLKRNVAYALGRAGWTWAPHALVQKVEGDLLGSVQVLQVRASWGDIMPGR